jgi:hypothetical protein
MPPPCAAGCPGTAVTACLRFGARLAGDPGDSHLTQTSRQQELAQIAGALASLAGRLTASAPVVRDFGRLVASARAIAAAAREINVSKWQVVERADALVQDLAGFAVAVEAAAERATAEVGRNIDVAQALLTSAARLGRLVSDEAMAGARHLLIAELAPLEATLASLQGGRAGSEVSQQAADLAARAAGLAQRALGLRAGGRASERAALDIHGALTDFARDAQAIAATMAHAATALSQAAALMAQQARAPPPAPPEPPKLAGVSWFAADRAAG